MAESIVPLVAGAAMSRLLGSKAMEDATNASDRTGGMCTMAGSSASQAVGATRTVINGITRAEPVDEFNSQNIDPFAIVSNQKKLQLLKRGTWTSDNGLKHESVVVDLPSNFFDTNTKPGFGNAKYFQSIRTNYTFEVQVNAVTGATGSLLVAWVPTNVPTDERQFNSFTLFPHVFLNVGSETTVHLRVPFISNKGFVPIISSENGTLKVIVWSKLSLPTGSHNSLDISVYGCLDGTNLQAPRYFQSPPDRKTDSRSLIDIGWGVGCLNLANSSVTTGATSVALVSDRAGKDHATAGSEKPIADLLVLVRTPSLLGLVPQQLRWSSNNEPGSILYQANLTMDGLSPAFELLSNSFHLWRGSLRLRLTVYCSTLHKGRLRLTFLPQPEGVVNLVPYNEFQSNCVYFKIIDIGLNSSIDFDIPFTSNMWARSVKDSIGRIQLFVSTRLSSSGATAADVSYRLFVSAGPDFRFYDPTWGGIVYQSPPDNETSPNLLSWEAPSKEMGDTAVVGDGDHMAIAAGLTDPGADSQVNEGERSFIAAKHDQIEIFGACHTSVANYFGRGTFLTKLTFVPGTQAFVIPSPKDNNQALLQSFLLWNGSITFAIYNDAADAVTVSHTYNEDDVRTTVDVTANGAVIIPQKTTMSIEVPFYVLTPHRYTTDEHPYGRLCVEGIGGGDLYLYMSFSELNLYVPLPPRNKTSSTLHALKVLNRQDGLSPFENFVVGSVKRYTRGHKFDLELSTKDFLNLYSAEQKDKDASPGPVLGLLFNQGGGKPGACQYVHADGCCYDVPAPRGDYKTLIVEDVDIGCGPFSTSSLPHKFACGKEILKVVPITGCDFIEKIKDAYECVHIPGFVIGPSDWMILVRILNHSRHYLVNQGFGSKILAKIVEGVNDISLRSVFMKIVQAVLLGIAVCNANTTGKIALGGLVACMCLEGEENELIQLAESLLKDDIGPMFAKLNRFVTGEDVPAHEIAVVVQSVAEAAPKQIKNQGFIDFMKDFNVISTTGNNVIRLLSLFYSLFTRMHAYFSPSERDRKDKIIKASSRKIAGLLTDADAMLGELSNPCVARSQVLYDRAREIMADLRILYTYTTGTSHTGIGATAHQLHGQLCNKTNRTAVNTDPLRVEPVGIWLEGVPGTGKSLFASVLAHGLYQKAAKEGLLHGSKPGTFFHPVGSSFCDGYVGQFVYCFDDFGQITDGEDVKLVCNMISSTPYVVPMAAIEEKGTSFASQFVIATTNKSDFVNTVTLSPAALERRFSFRFKVRPSEMYAKDGKLDVQKALENKSLHTLTCFEIGTVDVRTGLTNWYQADLGEIADQMCKKLADKWTCAVKLMEEAGMESLKKKDENGGIGRKPLVLQGIDDDVWDSRVYFDSNGMDLLFKKFSDNCDTTPSCFENLARCCNDNPGRYNSPSQQVLKWVDDLVVSAATWFSEKKETLAAVATGCSIVAAVISVATACRSFVCSEIDNVPEVQTIGEDQSAYNGHLGKRMRAKNKKLAPLRVNQGPNASEIAHLVHNLFFLRFTDGTSIVALALTEKTAVCYRHGLDGKELELIEYKATLYSVSEFTMQEVVVGNNLLDLVILCFPKLPFNFKSIVKHIKPVSEGADGLLVGIDKDLVVTTFAQKLKVLRKVSTIKSDGSIQMNPVAVSYGARTLAGSCGSLLLQKRNGALAIVAVHNAGDGFGEGLGVPLAEVVRQMFKENQGCVVSEVKGQILYCPPTTSVIKPSPVFGLFPGTKAPAPMSMHDSRMTELVTDDESLVVSAQRRKHKGNVHSVDEDFFQEVVTHLKDRLFTATGLCRKLTIAEAIFGVEGLLDPMDLSTSAGPKYPGGKKKYIEPTMKWIDPVLVRDVAKLDKCLQEEGALPKDVYTAYSFLKDEIVKESKIRTGNPRVVECFNLDVVVLVRMYTGAFCGNIYGANHSFTGIAVGINPYSDWSIVESNLSGYLYDADYSKFDGSLSLQLLRVAYDVIACCCEEGNRVKSLLDPFAECSRVAFNTTFEVKGSNASGNPLTSIVNSVCNLLATRYVVCGFNDVALDDLFVLTYGDDVILASPVLLDSDQMVSNYQSSFGLIATSASKDGTTLLQDLDTIVFLKRTFVYNNDFGTVVGPLSLSSMKESLRWTKGNFPEQFKSFMIELVFHGDRVYDETMDLIRDKMTRLNIRVWSYNEAKREALKLVFPK